MSLTQIIKVKKHLKIKGIKTMNNSQLELFPIATNNKGKLFQLAQDIRVSLISTKKKDLDIIMNEFNFQPLSSGSSRKVYANKELSLVIKVSKNLKGIAQNEQEISLSQDYYISNEVNKVLESFEINSQSFIVCELGQKVTVSKFESIFKIKFNEILDLFNYFYKSNVLCLNQLSCPAILEKYNKGLLLDSLNEFIYSIENLIGTYELVDSHVKNSYAFFGNELKLIDYGCTREILKEYYNR